MREFTKSMMSYSWALSVFGVQQVINLFKPGQGQDQTVKARQAFDRITDATNETFDQTLRQMFGTGDKLQQGVVDVMFGFTGGGLDPDRWIRMGNNAIKKVADLGRCSMESQAGVEQSEAPQAAQQNAPDPSSSGTPQDAGWGPMPVR